MWTLMLLWIQFTGDHASAAALKPGNLNPSAACAPDALAPELARLQGAWQTETGPRGDFKVQLTIRDHRATVRISSPLGPPIEAEAVIQIDPTQSPPAIDWTEIALGDGQPIPAIKGIFQHLGEDRWILRNAPFHGERPSQFDSGDSLLTRTVEFQRVEAESLLGNRQPRQ